MLEPEIDESDALLQRLMLDAVAREGQLGGSPSQGEIPFIHIIPTPGFCLKTKNESQEKIFINICMSDDVPEPKDISENELIKLLETDDVFQYRVPMGIGEPHAEMDKGGKGCTAYDVIINSKFYQKIHQSDVFYRFFLQLMLEGIESKYEQNLCREFVILKNRKSVGKLQEQRIRTQSKPVIMEMDEMSQSKAPSSLPSKSPLIQEMPPDEPKSRGKEPEYRIIQDPPEGHPEFLVAEINLPQVKTASTFSLDVGEDRILLQTRSNAYYLDVYLPYFLMQEECGAQFNRKTKILTITMPVQPCS